MRCRASGTEKCHLRGPICVPFGAPVGPITKYSTLPLYCNRAAAQRPVLGALTSSGVVVKCDRTWQLSIITRHFFLIPVSSVYAGSHDGNPNMQ